MSIICAIAGGIKNSLSINDKELTLVLVDNFLEYT